MKTACAAMLVATMSLASAQTAIYRCGADGRELSQQPCAGGQAVATSPGPSAAEQSEARARIAREQKLADRLEHDRHQREADETRRSAHAAGFNARPPPPAPSASAAPPLKKPSKPRSKKRR